MQAGLPADTAAVEALWKLLLEFQFHDTICGCSVHATYEREVPLAEALPYLAGGLIGGRLGGALYGKVPVTALKWMFAGFLFYAGVRYLL